MWSEPKTKLGMRLAVLRLNIQLAGIRIVRRCIHLVEHLLIRLSLILILSKFSFYRPSVIKFGIIFCLSMRPRREKIISRMKGLASFETNPARQKMMWAMIDVLEAIHMW